MAKIHDVRSPKDVLASALRDLKIAPQAKMVYERFPDLEGASEGLAWLFSERLMLPSPLSTAMDTVPLLHLCLKHAFEWMNYELTRDAPTLRTAQTAYMAGLLFHTPEILLVNIEADGDVWDIERGAPLAEWLPRHPGAEMTSRETLPPDAPKDDRQVRLLILRRILPFPVPRLEVQHASVLMPPDTLQPPRHFYG